MKKFFDLPRNTLVVSVGRYFDYNTLKKLSHVSRKAREIYYPLALCYETEDRDISSTIINQLIFTILHSERIFCDAELSNRIYAQLSMTKNQSNSPARIRFLRYLLLLILNKHYNMGQLTDTQMHERRLLSQLKILDTHAKNIDAELYYSKFNMIIEPGNLRFSLSQYDTSYNRSLILRCLLTLKQNTSELIQNIISELVKKLEQHTNVFTAAENALHQIRLTFALTNDVNRDLKINYDKLAYYARDKYPCLNIIDIILICASHNNQSFEILYKVYNYLLTRLILYSIKFTSENKEKQHLAKTTIAFLEKIVAILPFIPKNERYNLLFKITGLTLSKITSEIAMNYLRDYFDPGCFNDSEFMAKLKSIDINSCKVELYCLFALKNLYPYFVPIDVNFIINKYINKISVINTSENQPLISMCTNPLSKDQVYALYGRLKAEIENHNQHDKEEIMWAHHQTVTPVWKVKITTKISQRAILQILSLISDSLDRNQSLEILTFIVKISYETYFCDQLESSDIAIYNPLSNICSKITQQEKLRLIAEIMSKNKYDSFNNINDLFNTSPNCLTHLIDDSMLTMLLNSEIGTTDKLRLIDFLDLDKIGQENIIFYIKLLVSSIINLVDGKSYLGTSYKNYARWVWKMEKHIPINDKLTANIFMKYLVAYIMIESENVLFLHVEYLLIIRKYTTEDKFFDIIMNFLLKSRIRTEGSLNFIIYNIKRLFNFHEEFPTNWVRMLIQYIHSNNFSNIRAAVDIICALLLNDLVPMDDILLFQLKIAIDNLLSHPIRYDDCQNLLIVAARYYSAYDLIDWIKLLLDHDVTKHTRNSNIEENILNILLSFNNLMIFMFSQNENIRYLAYYYLSKNTPTLSILQCSRFFEHITDILNQKKSIPNYIVSILACYQTTNHYHLTATIVRKLFLECDQTRQIALIETYNFCKLIKPLLSEFDELTRFTIYKIIEFYINNHQNSQFNNIDLISNLSELLPTNMLLNDSENLPHRWISL